MPGSAAASRAVRSSRSSPGRWQRFRHSSSRRGCSRDERHPRRRRRDERPQARRVQSHAREAGRGAPRVSAARVRPGQGRHRAGCLVGGAPVVLCRDPRAPRRRRRHLAVGDDAGADPDDRRRNTARPGHPVLRWPLPRPVGCDSRGSRGGPVPRGSVQPAGIGRVIAVEHPLVPRRAAGDMAPRRHVRPLQHLPGEAADRRVGHRSVDDLDHRPVQHRCQRPDVEPGRPAGGGPSRGPAATAPPEP